jgi:hypothetical protein
LLSYCNPVSCPQTPGHIHNTSVLSIAIKNHSAPENPDRNQKPASGWHFSAGIMMPDGSMLPTDYYKKKSRPREKTGPEYYLFLTGCRDPVSTPVHSGIFFRYFPELSFIPEVFSLGQFADIDRIVPRFVCPVGNFTGSRLCRIAAPAYFRPGTGLRCFPAADKKNQGKKCLVLIKNHVHVSLRWLAADPLADNRIRSIADNMNARQLDASCYEHEREKNYANHSPRLHD